MCYRLVETVRAAFLVDSKGTDVLGSLCVMHGGLCHFQQHRRHRNPVCMESAGREVSLNIKLNYLNRNIFGKILEL